MVDQQTNKKMLKKWAQVINKIDNLGIQFLEAVESYQELGKGRAGHA
ncbi:hypothetical protein GQS40_00385|uniref:Uncharacterized protein n=1 Tax=Leuconostoc lactis TaxID=1246 RepID=A0A6L7A4S6_LEULA|nr:hypothetical protein [Leuconostoc lactis]